MEPNRDIIEEYFSKLPDVVQECIKSKEWQRRINEIASKYSLNNKRGTLQYEIFFVVTGIETEEDLPKNLKNELSISDLLAEQLAKDIEQRILSWVDKLYESSKIIKKESSPNQPENKNLVEINEKIPEVRPNMVPMVEEGESVKVVEPPHNFAPKFITQQPALETLINQNKDKEEIKTEATRINYKPKEVVDEIIQKPIPVPRFTSTPENAPEKPVENKTVNTINNVPIPLKTTPPIPEPPKQQEKPVHKYVSDPYREPIE